MTIRNVVRAQRRKVQWHERNPESSIAGGGIAGLTLLDIPTQPALVRSTITRTLLTIVFDLGADETVGDSVRLDYGIAILSSDAVAAASLPDPNGSPPDAGMWLFRDMREVIAISTGRDPRQLVTVQYDLGSQRILRQDDVVVLVVENTTLVGAMSMDVRVMCRMLVKLP